MYSPIYLVKLKEAHIVFSLYKLITIEILQEYIDNTSY